MTPPTSADQQSWQDALKNSPLEELLKHRRKRSPWWFRSETSGVILTIVGYCALLIAIFSRHANILLQSSFGLFIACGLYFAIIPKMHTMHILSKWLKRELLVQLSLTPVTHREILAPMLFHNEKRQKIYLGLHLFIALGTNLTSSVNIIGDSFGPIWLTEYAIIFCFFILPWIIQFNPVFWMLNKYIKNIGLCCIVFIIIIGVWPWHVLCSIFLFIDIIPGFLPDLFVLMLLLIFFGGYCFLAPKYIGILITQKLEQQMTKL
ncbi:hypothetical protein JXA32_11420 [Candidatus Sumerlaeota bacterium]|nr:hypothetical protein [Candidatus Sumerlaeota bacterium]